MIRSSGYICFMNIKKRRSGVERVGQPVNYDDSRSSIEARSTNRQVLDRLYNDMASRAGVLGKLDSTLSRDESGEYVRRLKDRSYAEYEEGGEMMMQGMQGQQPSQSDPQQAVMQMKQLHEEATQSGDMEKVGQIEMMIQELHEKSDEKVKQMIDEMFPELDFLSQGMEEEEQMMKRGGAMLYKF